MAQSRSHQGRIGNELFEPMTSDNSSIIHVIGNVSLGSKMGEVLIGKDIESMALMM